MTVGILGAGQLGRMLALAGYPLGLDFLFLDKEAGTPAGQVAPTLTGSFTDPALLDELARRSTVVTVDWENVPLVALEHLAPHTRIAPPLAALATGQRCDLLLTDIALGVGMRGSELARQVRGKRPHAAVLLMSGYSAEMLQAPIGSGAPWELLRKPFERDELARAIVRAVTAHPPGPRA